MINWENASNMEDQLDQSILEEDAEKLDAFILQHHGYLRLAERYEAPVPEVMPFNWEQFSIWWKKTPRATRDNLLQILASY